MSLFRVCKFTRTVLPLLMKTTKVYVTFGPVWRLSSAEHNMRGKEKLMRHHHVVDRHNTVHSSYCKQTFYWMSDLNLSFLIRLLNISLTNGLMESGQTFNLKQKKQFSVNIIVLTYRCFWNESFNSQPDHKHSSLHKV